MSSQPLSHGMTHQQAVNFLRNHFLFNFCYETSGLTERPAPWVLTRTILCALDFIAALYCGWDGTNRRQIARPGNCTRFLTEVFPVATGNERYGQFAEHLYEMFRTGTVHQRNPKRFVNLESRSRILTWAFLQKDPGVIKTATGETLATHLTLVHVAPDTMALPISIKALYRDFVQSCEYFAEALEREAEAGGGELLRRWRQTADALSKAEDTHLTW